MPNLYADTTAPQVPDLDPFERLLSESGMSFATVRSRVVAVCRASFARDPENVADEVMYRVWRRVKQGAAVEKKALLGYCFGFARFVMTEHRRKVQPGPLPAAGFEKPRCAGRGELQPVEQAILLSECLAGLSANDRQLLMDYSTSETRNIHAALGISPGAVRLRVYHARGKLNARLRR